MHALLPRALALPILCGLLVAVPMPSPVLAQADPRPQIEEIKPPSAEVGQEVTIYLVEPIPTRVREVSVTFDGRSAPVDHYESRVIDLRVPQGLKEGSRPSVQVWINKQASAPFGKFQVTVATPPPQGGTDPKQSNDPPGDKPADKQTDEPAGWTDWLLPVAGSLIGILALVGWLRARSRLKALEKRNRSITADDVVDLVRGSLTNPGAQQTPTAPSPPQAVTPQPAPPPAPAPEPEPFTLPAPELPKELVAACVRGECVLYAGAGLSARSGLPFWVPLVGAMIDWAEDEQHIDGKQAAKLRIALREGSADEVAGIVLAHIGNNRPRLQEFLRTIFADPELKPSDEHRLLRQIRFGAVLTTNYDDLLEATFDDRQPDSFTPDQAEDLLAALTRQRFFIGKLYGRLDSDKGVMVAPAEYSDYVAGNAAFGKFMETLFLSRTLLFLGASLDGLDDYLAAVRVQRYGERMHYALVAVTDQSWEIKAQTLERRYGIQVIPYTPQDDFSGFHTFIEALHEQVTQEDPADPAVEQSAEGAGHVTGKTNPIKRIHLENIGPFPELTLDLDSHWNILLGDNGVGKSTVLKALAVAYCGSDAAPFAGRLITDGKNTARIVLETERTSYFTDLKRMTDGAQVISKPNRPLEMEGSLAIAFPAIRALSWQRPRGPSTDDRNSLSADDLLPLIRGEPDPRLDKLKQWFINLDYRLKSGEPRMRKILEDFNHVLKRLAVGITMQVGEIDTRTYEISMITDDGNVAIEKVSQGTASLIGWTGILLQRFYEVFLDDDDPKQRYALVMIDEIDAHMHPEWQQSLVPALSEVFPNAQFIATTHSPLIVGGMESRQIIRFERDDDGSPQALPVPDDMTMGRADQILTGSLFGLDSTLDKTTQGRIVRYQRLLGKSSPTPAEKAELQQLQGELDDRIPVPREGPVERRAEELLEALLKSQVGDDHPEAQEALMAKARQLFEALEGDGGAKS